MSNDNNNPECRNCGDEYPTGRWALGYKWCKPCGEIIAKQVVRTIVPMHKSNYMLFTDASLLKQLNPKRTT
jgi:ribosomal protein L37AE/L43A